MLTKITIRNFKSFRFAEIELGRWNLLVGANASGKSNFFDALRVLQGIGNGFTVREILDGKRKTDTSETRDGIRGGSAFARLRGEGAADRFEVAAAGRMSDGRVWRYSITISPADGRVAGENLFVAGHDYFDTPAGDLPDPTLIGVRWFTGKPGGLRTWPVNGTRPILWRFVEGATAPEERRRVAEEIARQLADTLCFDPSPPMLRRYSELRQADRMGERGENFAAVVEALCADATTKDCFLGWLRALRSEGVDDVGTLRGARGGPLFLLRDRGREFPATVLGDGTLRFAALVAAFFQPAAPALLAIEGIERGIHANRARLLVELIRRLSSEGGPQVIATTHSPAVLAWLRASDYASTFFCRRDPETRETTIRPLLTLDYAESALATASLGDLFAEGWMEAASEDGGPS